jgi:hypothetical protein
MDGQRLADALAYEQERRRRLANVVPVPANGQPEVAPTPSLRSNLENLSIGLGEGLTNQLEGVRALVTDPIGSAKGAYEGVMAAVRDPAIIADALRYTAQRASSGPLGAGEVIGEMVGPMRTRGTPVMQEIDVYHGSPHRFEEFDASKIGTGEGAQAYGHGVYLAESPRVAREYAHSNQGRGAAAEGLIDALPKHMQMEVYKVMQRQDGPIKDAMIKDVLSKYPEAASVINAKSGNLYTADLPDEMVDRMLDWDKPLGQQPAAVRETVMRYMNVGEKQLPADMRVGQIGDKYVVLQDKPPLPGSTFGVGRSVVKGPKAASEQEAVDAYWNSLTGKDFYDTIGKDLGKNADASDYMRQLGIPGIKYADAGSRGQGGSGTRNFVVFPGEEKKVKILKRE